MASTFKPDNVPNKEYEQKQTTQHKVFRNDQTAYELQSMDAFRDNSLQKDHVLSLVTHAGKAATTANLNNIPSFRQAEISQDPQSMPEIGNVRSRSAPTDTPHVPGGLTILPGQLKGGNLLIPLHGPSIEQRRMQLSSQGLNLEESRSHENLGRYPTKAAEILNQQQPDSIADGENICSIQSDHDSKGDISARSPYSEAVPVIQDRRVPKDKQVVYYPGGQHYQRTVAIEGDVADHKLPLDTTIDKDDEDGNKVNHLVESAELAQFSRASSSKQEDYEAESSRISGNLDDEAQRQNESRARLVPRIAIDQPTEETERQSVRSEVEVVPSSSASRTPQLDRTLCGQKKPTSDYDALKDILLVYQGREIASNLDTKRGAVQVAPGEAGELDAGRQQFGKGNAHKRSAAFHLSAGPKHQFNEIKPLNIRSKHCDELGSNEDIDTQAEDGYSRSQDDNFSEYSWMSSNRDNVDSQAASSDLASRSRQEEDDDLRSEESDKLSDSTAKDEVSESAESFSTSHLELGDPFSEGSVDHVTWNSNGDFLEGRHADKSFMNMWPEGSQHLRGQVGRNQNWRQENDIENQNPSLIGDVERMGETSGLEESKAAASEVDVISSRGRDLLPSRYRSPTPPLLFGRRPIVHKQGRRDLLNRSSLTEIRSELAMKGKSHPATAVIIPNDPDWESVTEQKSSEDKNTAVADEIVNTMPDYEDNEADHLDFGNMSAQLAEQCGNAGKEGEEVTDSKHEESPAYFPTYGDKMNTLQPLRKSSLEDQVNSGDPFDDLESESSASLSTHLTKKMYQHPSPLIFGHVAPLRGSSLLRASPPLQDLPARKLKSEPFGSMTDFQHSDMSLMPANSSVKGKRPLRADDASCHSSLWLSTVEERQSELSSSRSMKGGISRPVPVSSNQVACKNPFYLPNTRNERGLGAISSSIVPFPSRLDFATEFSSGQQDPITSSQTHVERSKNGKISSLQGEDNLNFSTMYDTSHQRDRKTENAMNVGASTQSSSSNWLHTDKSQQSNSECGSMQPKSSPESEDGPIDWSKAYSLYLPPLGPRQNGRQSSSSVASPLNQQARITSGVEIAVNSGHDQFTETGNSQGGRIWVTRTEKGILSGGMPNPAYHLSHQRLQASPNSLLPSPQVHCLRNGQVFTEGLPRFQPHPVYGFDCPWDRRHPFARSESPHLHAREMRDTPESRVRERVYSVTFAVFCCLTVVLAPLYGHGLLDSVMVRVSDGEFRRFRHQDKLFVLTLTYIILALLVVVLPITVITLSN